MLLCYGGRARWIPQRSADCSMPSRAARRLRGSSAASIPFIFICYVVAYIDRVNIGFAATELQRDLGLSDAAYGLGGGLFFLGYCLFEIPSNLIIDRVGARIWIARIMIGWGLVSMAMMFVVGQWSFYAMRVLLGIAEAGFFPGMVLYLTYWVPAAERARTGALFMTAAPVAVLVGVAGVGSAAGARRRARAWRDGSGCSWSKGLPAVVLGVIALVVSDRSPGAGDLAAGGRAGVVERSHGARAGRARRASPGLAPEGAPERARAAHLLHLFPEHARHLRRVPVAPKNPARRVRLSRLAVEPRDGAAVRRRARRHGAHRPALGSNGRAEGARGGLRHARRDRARAGRRISRTVCRSSCSASPSRSWASGRSRASSGPSRRFFSAARPPPRASRSSIRSGISAASSARRRWVGCVASAARIRPGLLVLAAALVFEAVLVMTLRLPRNGRRSTREARLTSTGAFATLLSGA